MNRLLILGTALCLAALPIKSYAADIDVDQVNGQFTATAETLAKGDALVLVNKDSGPHDINVIDEDGDPTDLGVQQPGASVRIKFTDPGIYKLRCAISPSMHMSVTVN